METLKAREPWKLRVRIVFVGDRLSRQQITYRIISVDAESPEEAMRKAVAEILPKMQEAIKGEGYEVAVSCSPL